MELGHSCYVVSLPKKWVDANKIEKGDELNLDINDLGLVFSSEQKKTSQKIISYDLNFSLRTSLRAFIINAYRAGYDRLELSSISKKQEVYDIVSKDLIGFEVFSEKDLLVVESVSEPNFDTFEKLIQKRFFLVGDILKNLFTEDIKQQMIVVQRYDNFIKRCMVKLSLKQSSQGFLWQWTSDITHIAKESYHAQNKVNLLSYKPSKQFSEVYSVLLDMFSHLQNGYLKKDVKELFKIHSLFEKLFLKKRTFMNEDPLLAYFFFHIARIIHYSSSPLIGYLQLLS